MKKWFGGLMAAIISGVVIYWMTVGWQHKDPPPPPTPTHMGDLESNVSRDYSDYANFPSKSPIQCSNLCLADIHCKAMTFVPHGAEGTCWLKNTVPEPRTVQGDTSAIKIDAK